MCLYVHAHAICRSENAPSILPSAPWLTSIYSAPRTNHACFCMLRLPLSCLAGIPWTTEPWPSTSLIVQLVYHWLRWGAKVTYFSRVRLSRQLCNGTDNSVWVNIRSARTTWPHCARESSLRASFHAWGKSREWTCQARDNGPVHTDKGGAVVAGRSWGVLGSGESDKELRRPRFVKFQPTPLVSYPGRVRFH